MQGYLPVHVYKVGQVGDLNTTCKVKGEDLLPMNEEDKNIYFKNFNEYVDTLYKPLKKSLQKKVIVKKNEYFSI